MNALLDHLQKGGVAAVATETVYGLAADMSNPAAVHKLYELKQRGLDKPMSVAVSNVDMLWPFVDKLSEEAKRLIEKYWPGPLTLLLPCNDNVPKLVNNGKGIIGVRAPNAPHLLQLLEDLGHPICLTSANITGESEATTPDELFALFGDAVFIDPTPIQKSQKPSTILDVSVTPFSVVREGEITFSALQRIIC
jgi:L-threonylcarbamoyladenylate synthase